MYIVADASELNESEVRVLFATAVEERGQVDGSARRAMVLPGKVGPGEYLLIVVDPRSAELRGFAHLNAVLSHTRRTRSLLIVDAWAGGTNRNSPLLALAMAVCAQARELDIFEIVFEPTGLPAAFVSTLEEAGEKSGRLWRSIALSAEQSSA